MISTDAPVAPGVYYLLSRRQLVYVGKAANLRRRLADHERSGRWSDITTVRWELVASPQAALSREAAVLAALQPPRNKTHVEIYFNFVRVTDRGLELGHDGDYGCFPHLGRGAMSAPGRACIDGFDALARIVQATDPDRDDLDAFLAGRTDRLFTRELQVEQPHIRHGLERDLRTAHGFFEAGPKAMRQLRLRHGGRGPVSPTEFRDWITAEVRELLGPLD